MEMGRNLLLLVTFSIFGYSYSADYCVIDNLPKRCENGCCDDKCCDGMSTWAIVGAVIGGIMMIISVVCCIFCIYYACKRHKRSSGSTVQPYTNTNSVFIHNNPYGQPAPRTNPPAYSQASGYPYSSDPAYPPGSVHPPPAYTYTDPSKK